jgi:outer membrane protein assembly factor BamB
VSSYEGFIYAYDTESGALRWTGPKVQLIGSDTLIPSPSDIRPVEAVGQYIVVGSARGYVTTYDASSGQKKWNRNSTAGAVDELHAVGQSRVLTTHIGGQLTLFDLATGTILWQFSPRSESERIYAVRVMGDTVFTTSIGGGVSALKLP